MKPGLEAQDLHAIQQVFKRFPQIKSVVLFGSRATGNFKKGSDVDLALKGNIDASILSGVQRVLNQEISLPYFFDVIAYDEIENLDLKNHIYQY